MKINQSMKQEIELEKKNEALQLLSMAANKIINVDGLGINAYEPEPAQKKIEYLQKAKWARERKNEALNNVSNIDYSAYHKQAIRYNNFATQLGITEQDVDKAYVELILALDGLGDNAIGIIQDNRQILEDVIKNASSIQELEVIKETMDINLRIGLS